MILKKLGMAFGLMLILGAVAVSSASAAATTTPAQWYTGAGVGTTLPTGTTKALTATIEKDPELEMKKLFLLESEAGSTPFSLTATGLECEKCTIANKPGIKGEEPTVKPTNPVIATGAGKLRFTGVTVMSPAGCKVAGGSITTNALTVHADFMNGAGAVQQFFPTSGGIFASFTIENETGFICPVAGTYLVKGTLFSDAITLNAEGTEEKKKETNKAGATQLGRTSPAIQMADGGGLEIGVKAAKLTGTAAFSIGGTEFNIH